MKLRELSIEEFSSFALQHKQNNFHQTFAWAELKARNGWQFHLVGLINKNNDIIAASLLLSKKIFGNINIMYAPRGFLIDYKNDEILKSFTFHLKKYAKEKKVFTIKIDPYVMYKERDIDGNLVPNGIDNSVVVTNLKKLGYRHYGFTVYQGTLQPRWMFVLDVEGKTNKQILDEVYYQTTRHSINKTLKLSYDIEEVNLNTMEEFKHIMEETSKRRGFADRPLSYYKNMYEILNKHNMIKIYLVKLNCNKCIKQLKKENDDINEQISTLNKKIEDGKNKNVILKQIKVLKESLVNNDKKTEEFKDLKKMHGNVIVMSGAMFIVYGDEVLYLYSGTYDEFLKYQAPYCLQWEMINYAIKNKYKRYNFYGISGSFDKRDPAYGVYAFKKGFNGYVVELIGEFDLIINKYYYYLYVFSFSIYRNIKRLKTKLYKKKI